MNICTVGNQPGRATFINKVDSGRIREELGLEKGLDIKRYMLSREWNKLA